MFFYKKFFRILHSSRCKRFHSCVFKGLRDFLRKRFSCLRNRFSRKFRSKNDHPVGFAGWSQEGIFGFSDFAGWCAGIAVESTPSGCTRPDYKCGCARSPACSFHFFQLPQRPLRVFPRPKLRPDPPRVRRVALVVLLRHRVNQLRQLAQAVQRHADLLPRHKIRRRGVLRNNHRQSAREVC